MKPLKTFSFLKMVSAMLFVISVSVVEYALVSGPSMLL